MVELIADLSATRIAANLARIRSEIAQAQERSPHASADEVRILAATKYVADENLEILHEAGLALLGENRAQDLARKFAEHGALFEWHFIGQLQSRRVRTILPCVRLIHSVASQSALAEIERHHELAQPDAGILIEVNVSGEPGKAGVPPGEIAGYIEGSALPVRGLMTMPPLSGDPELSRHWFTSLRELAAAHGLAELSMGTSQDYLVAVEEGASIVRIGTNLYH
jgi:pyridoxal phosphate enzyme (YggS family)